VLSSRFICWVLGLIQLPERGRNSGRNSGRKTWLPPAIAA
jgi:hypothetical protein